MLRPRPCWGANTLGWILGKGKVGGGRKKGKRRGGKENGQREGGGRERKKGREEICAVVIVP